MARIDNMEEKAGLDFIKKSVVELEQVRIQEMKNLQMLQEVKSGAMQLEAERLTLKYGENHPQVLRINQRLAYNKQMLPALKEEIQRTAPNNDIPDDDTYRLQGRVFDGQLQPVSNITVFLTDEKRNWVRELGNYCTGEDGFYRFVFNQEMVKRLQQMSLFLAASDANQKLLCNSQTPLTIQINEVEYRDIYLGTKNCAPPPGGNKNDDVINVDRDKVKDKTEEEAKVKAEEERRRKAEEEAKVKAEEERKRKAEEEAKVKAEEERKRKAEDEARTAEEKKRRAEEDRKRKAEEDAKSKAEEERKRKEEEDKKKRDDNNIIRPDRERIRPIKGVDRKAIENKAAPKKAADKKAAPSKNARKKEE